MDSQPDHMSVHEAADYYGVSEKTIRRRLKAGKLQAFKQEVEAGRLEWRILRVDRADLSWTGHNDHDGQDTDTPDGPGEDSDQGETVHRDAVLLNALQLVDRLQRENVQLAGQVGFLQSQLQESQEQVRLLSAPKEEEQPRFWQRLFGRR